MHFKSLEGRALFDQLGDLTIQGNLTYTLLRQFPESVECVKQETTYFSILCDGGGGCGVLRVGGQGVLQEGCANSRVFPDSPPSSSLRYSSSSSSSVIFDA